MLLQSFQPELQMFNHRIIPAVWLKTKEQRNSAVAGSVSNYAYQTNIYTQKVWPFYSKNERDIFQRIVLQSEFVKAAPPPLKGKDATSSLDDVEILNGHI